MKNSWRRLLLSSFLILSTVGCDQVTKGLAQERLSLSGPLEYLGGLFTLQYAENTGAFLSLGARLDPSARFWLFTIGAAALLLPALFYLLRARVGSWSAIGLSLLIGGGIGNLIDRATVGYVIDFINIGIGPVRTGIFNIADVAIVAGVAVLFWRSRERQPV